MCEICHGYPCFNGCPGAPEPAFIGVCNLCNDKIYVGERYANIHGELDHEECLGELSVDDWLEKFGLCCVKEAELDYE